MKKDTKKPKAIDNKLEVEKTEKKSTEKDATNFPGYPVYPASDDIYNRDKEEKDLNPEDLTKIKSPNEEPGTMNEKDFEDDMTGEDLDIPGSEADEKEENEGSEDEENNYYSLGGDDHNDLDEDRAQ